MTRSEDLQKPDGRGPGFDLRSEAGIYLDLQLERLRRFKELMGEEQFQSFNRIWVDSLSVSMMDWALFQGSVCRLATHKLEEEMGRRRHKWAWKQTLLSFFSLLLALALLLFLLAVLSIPVSGAPAPKPRIKPVPQVTAGTWILTWGGTDVEIKLNRNGTFTNNWGGGYWTGSWGWNHHTRRLFVNETSDYVNWMEWTVVLDNELKGEGEFGYRRLPISLRKSPVTQENR